GVFTSIYAAAYGQHHGFPARELLEHLTPVDTANWRLMLTSPGRLVPFDAGRSFAAVFLLGAAAWLPWLRVPQSGRLFSLWFLLVTLVVLVIPVRFGEAALWRFAVDVLPGFSAIRDPRRIQFPFELAAALAFGLFVAQLPRSSAARRSVVAFVLVV